MRIPKEGHYEMLKPFEAPSARLRREYVKTHTLKVDFPKKVTLPPSVTTLGEKLGQIYENVLHDTKANFIGDFEEAVANSNKILWLAHHTPNVFYDIDCDDQENPEFEIYTRTESSFMGVILSDADTLSRYLKDMEDDETMLEEVGLDEESLWRICALHWLMLADRASTQAEKFDFIAEALVGFSSMINHATWFSMEELDSESKREAAKQRWENDPKKLALAEIGKCYEEKKSKFKLRAIR